MTDAERTAKRFEDARRLFSLTGEEFKREVLTKFRGAETRQGPGDSLRKLVQVDEGELCGRTWYRMYRQGNKPGDIRKKVMFLHGGGCVLESGPHQFAFAAQLAEEENVDVWFPSYHLAPEHYCMDAISMVTELYRMMLAETGPKEIVLLGDSAGGSLAVSSAMYFREQGLPQPRRLILLSPSVDMREAETQEEIAWLECLERRDQLFLNYGCFQSILDLWRRDLPRDDYRVTPGCGDLRGLAPMTLFAGTADILNMGQRRFWRQAREQGADIAYMEYAMKPHNWILSSEDASAERAYIAALVRG